MWEMDQWQPIKANFNSFLSETLRDLNISVFYLFRKKDKDRHIRGL